jgi:GR25 family glycosyltransferase involved in LPS biosynthesis
LEKYFIPLLNTIKDIAPDIEVIAAINGEHNEPLDETYRKAVLRFISERKNVIPVMYPCFRGLSKLWNNILITASNDYILILNDDVSITDGHLLKELIAILMRNEFRSFKINGCWSHVLLNKWEVDEVGYFDERLLGIGEEDRDFEWRYINHYNREFASYNVDNLINHSDMSYAPNHIKIGLCNKYSLFNYNFIYNEKYHVNEQYGKQLAMWPEKMVPVLENRNQYPYEKFFRERKSEL